MNPGIGYLLAVFLVLLDLLKGINSESESISDQFQSEFAKASWDFGLDLLKTIGSDDGENVLVSPSSVAVLLAILQQGAGGNTASQLEKTLRLSAEKSRLGHGHVINSYLQREKTNFTFEWGNRGYVVPGFELNRTLMTAIEENFNATIEELDVKELSPFEAAQKINTWLKEATHDSINALVDDALIAPDMVMLMINAVYLKSMWDSPFKKHKTRMDTFHICGSMSVEVPFMRQTGKFMVGEDDDLGIMWTELPFQGGNFSTVFILPEKDREMKGVLQNLTGSDLMGIIENSNLRRVKLTLPKFELGKKVSLAETLKKLGLTDVFTDESDLRGLSSAGKPLHVSHMIHEAHVELDEEGTKASAAATFDIVQTLSLDWNTDEIDFRADRPFLFFIVDKLNGIPVFAGKVTNPKTS